MRKFYTGKMMFFLLSLLLTALCIPPSQAQQRAQKRISIRMEENELSRLLQQVGEASGYRIFYNDQLVNGLRASADYRDETVDRILIELLTPHRLTYSLDDDMIVISPVTVQAADQPRNITGKVTDRGGAPLVGVNVLSLGSTRGTVTDAHGEFSLTIPGGTTRIQLSFLGMQTRIVEVDDRSRFQITLEEEVAQMANVVVTGYYTQSQTSYTGAAKIYTGEQLLTAGNSNVMKSLSTIDPSFMRVENLASGSNPNALPHFQIRGETAINFQQEYQTNPNLPLFIVDGFESDAETVYDMDIFRVQSVTILKDASATAIYGSRASNGVVVITTLAPQSGKLQIRYNVDLEFEAADLSDYNLMNAREKLDTEIAAGMYSFADESDLSTRERVYGVLRERQGYVLEGVDTYWLDKPLHSLAVGHRHRVSIDGGDQTFRYQLTGMYQKSPGVMKESFRERKNISMKLIYNYKNFRFSNEIAYNVIDSQESPFGSFRAYTLLNPYLRYKDQQGNYLAVVDVDRRQTSAFNVYSPLFNSTLNTRNDSRSGYFTNNLNVVWNVNDDLRIEANLSVRDTHGSSDNFKPRQHTDFANYTGANFGRRGRYVKSSSHNSYYDGNLIASYQKSLDRHTLTGRVGYNIRENKTESYTVTAEGFPNDYQDDLGFALQYLQNSTPSSTNYTTRMIGLLGNFNYIYDERYMADFSFRYDAQSSFGKDRKWAPFWSAGIGWNLHKESFLAESTLVNQLKLRSSFGETGSVDYSPAQALTTYGYLQGTRYLFSQGAMMKALGNRDLGWQKTLQWNAGVDAIFLDNRVNLTFDYYIKTTNNMITSLSIAPSTGYGSYMANLGKVENKGFELYARVEALRIPSHQFTLSFFGQLMRNRNQLKQISNSLRAYNDQTNSELDGSGNTDAEGNKINRPRVNYIEGKPTNAIWVNQSMGIDPATGREFFLNLADETYTDTWSSVNNVYGGTTDPKFYGTFGLSVAWKSFYFNAYFGYRYGGHYYNQTLVDKVEDADLRYNVDKRMGSDRWQQPGDISRFTALTTANGNANTDRATRPTSRFIEKRNYVELQTVSAGYDFRGRWIEASRIENLRVTFNMEDLFHSSTVRTERGTDYPYARKFSVGFQITF